MPVLKKSKKKNKHFLYQRGRIANSGLLFLGLMVLVSITFINGAFPSVNTNRNNNTKADTSEGSSEIVFNTTPDPGENTLQMKTFTLKGCGNTAAVNFIIDNSGSMQYGSKMENLKSALQAFAEDFPENGVVTMQTYSGTQRERVPFEKTFGQSKQLFLSQVNAMRVESATHSKDAFIFAKSKLDAGIPKFPNHKFAVVFISDGIPETGAQDAACPGGINGPMCSRNPDQPSACRCFDPEQDPTDIAAQIKYRGIPVYTLVYTDTADQKFDGMLKNMMRNVATTPEHMYVAPLNNQVVDIIKQIKTKICKS